MERRFACTACGKCCFGWLPLTLGDALAHAHRFPLALVWTPVRQGGKAFDLTARLGVTLRLPDRKRVAVRVTPTAYVPPSFPCPSLTPEGLCGIHEDKPLRCRTMPFFPYHEERDQAASLIPRAGWACDTSKDAPVVYRDKKIVGREDFDREKTAILRDAPDLRSYAESHLAKVPGVREAVARAASQRAGGQVVRNFSAILYLLEAVDIRAFARRQLPVLRDFAAATSSAPETAEYHKYYLRSAAEMERLLA